MNLASTRINLFLLVVLVLISPDQTVLAQTPEPFVTSPDGRVAVSFRLDDDGQPEYAVRLAGKEILGYSPLGLQTSLASWDRDLNVVETSDVDRVEDRYRLVHGKRRDVQYEANWRMVQLADPEGHPLEIHFQVSNDGVAVRYAIPEQSGADEAVVHRELTGFRFSPEAVSWLMPMDHPQTGWMNTNPSYEGHYVIAQPVGLESPTEVGWSIPALFHDESAGWALVMESDVDDSYVGARLTAEPERGLYRIGFPDRGEGYGPNDPVDPRFTLPFESPWRVVIVGETPAPIIESTLVTDVASPSALESTDWIVPGKASWSWLPLKDDSVVPDVQREFIDLAAEYDLEYTLVDALWDQQIGYEEMAELAKYAESRGVGLLAWYNSNGSFNGAPQTPKNRMNEPAARREEFARLRDMGFRGVKVDFMGGDKQSVIKLYLDIIRDAADYQIMVNFHGATVPRGWERTYPHLVSMEAVRGYEYSTFDQYNADHAPQQGTILPFTRNAVGPMDYTPTMLTPRVGNSVRRTSNGYELAMLVVFESGVQHLGVTPDVMANLPEFVRDYISEVPAAWDDTRFVDGYPGTFVVLARRTGTRWYVAGVNGTDEERSVRLDLPFVGTDWTGTLIGDDSGTSGFSEREVSDGDEVVMGPYGGFVVEISAD